MSSSTDKESCTRKGLLESRKQEVRSLSQKYITRIVDAARKGQGILFSGERLSLIENDAENITGINASVTSSERDSITLKIINIKETEDDKVDKKEGVVNFDDDDIPPLDLMEALGAEKADYKQEEINPTLEKIFWGEQSHLTLDKGLLVAFPVLTITLITVFRGSKTLKSLISVER